MSRAILKPKEELIDHTAAYIQELEPLVRFMHGPRFRRLWTEPTRDGEWFGRFNTTQSFALLFAVLHRGTGEQRYLRLAKRFLLDFDSGFHFSSLFCGRAYELIGELLSPSERVAFTKGWVAGVQRDLYDKVGIDPAAVAAWNNVSNHALCACVYADYVRKLFPDEAARYRYERITDAVWNVWWKRREFQEQASNYEGFSEAFHCAWAELRGVAREFYVTPSVLNMLERGEKVVSPSGIVTAYGDGGHNEHAAAWIALFEKAAHETGNGRWKQVAWDIFSYLKRRELRKAAQAMSRKITAESICNARILHGCLLGSLSWLALAALWSDPKLKPRPRTDPCGVIARLPRGHVLAKADRRTLPKDRLVLCQVALTGGPASRHDRTYLLLSVGPALIHDHRDAGSILMLSRGDTILLGTNGYLQREIAYHNAFYVQSARRKKFPDLREDPSNRETTECPGTLQALRVEGATSYCRIFFDRYLGDPVSLTREVIIDVGGGVTILDRATAQVDGLRGGPLFHGESVRKLDPRSYAISLDTLRSMNGITLANAPGELLVNFIYPDSDVHAAELGSPSIYTASPVYRRFPCSHYVKVWRESYTGRTCLAVSRLLRRGEEALFITRLIPRPERDSDCAGRRRQESRVTRAHKGRIGKGCAEPKN